MRNITMILLVLVFLISVSSCSPKQSENIQLPKPLEPPLLIGSSPEEKLDNLVGYMNKKWPGRVRIGARYVFLTLTITDKVIATITVFPVENIPRLDNVVNELLWQIANEIQPDEISIRIQSSEGAYELILLNSGAEIRQGKAEKLKFDEFVTSKQDSLVFLFPLDSENRQGIYEPSWSRIERQTQNSQAKRMADFWHQKWPGKVLVITDDSSPDKGELESVTYVIALAFDSISRAEYLKESHSILGEMYLDLLETTNVNDVRFFVYYATQDDYYYYSKDTDKARDYLKQGPRPLALSNWTHFFVVKPFISKFFVRE